MKQLRLLFTILLCTLLGGVEGQAENYTKVTSTSELEEGAVYVIAETSESTKYLVTGYGTKLTNVTTGFSVSGNTITTSTATPLEFTLGKTGNNYTLKFDDSFLGYNSGTNFASNTSASNNKFQWSIGNDFVITNVNTTTRVIARNGASIGAYSTTNNYPRCYLFKKQASFTLTAVSNNENYGTVSTSGNVITATPKEGYRISNSIPYTIAEGTATVTQNENTFTVSATADCTVQINFEVIPSHNVTFSVNGTTTSQLVYEGTSITFPDSPTAIGGKTFVGWSTDDIVGTTDEQPTLISKATMGTEDVIFYAVFAKATGSGTVWKKITTIAEEGTYVLLTNEERAFNGTISSGHGQSTTQEFIFNEDDIATTIPEGICELEFTATEDNSGYTMYNSEYGYLYASAAKSGSLAWKDNENSYWFHTEDENKNWSYQSNNAYLRTYNSTFRTYGNNNGDPIHFAQKIDDLSYADFCTTIAEETINISVSNAEYATLYFGNYNLIVPENVEAYTIKQNSGQALVRSTTYETGDIIPAGTAVVVHGAANTYDFALTDEAGTADENNLLRGSDVAELTTGPVEGTAYKFYMLSLDAEKTPGSVGFYFNKDDNEGGAFMNGAHKAYLSLEKDAGAKSCYLFSELEAAVDDTPAEPIEEPGTEPAEPTEDETVTGINALHEAAEAGMPMYNLQGQRVGRDYRGIVIVNGRKFKK